VAEVDQAVVEELVGNAHGNFERVKELVEAHPGAVTARASWNETAVEAATQMGNKPIIEYLLSRGAELDFFTALVLGRLDLVDAELAREPARANARGVHDLPALYFAAIGGSIETAGRLLDAGADVNAQADAAAPIHGAVMSGSPEMVRFLLEQGADAELPDYKGRDARQLAVDMSRADVADLIAEFGLKRA
jgi:ankyrin repeat protein